MSFKFPRVKFKALSARHIIVIGLVVIHTVWILTHLTLVARGQINPWKLGGYGMYTLPDYKAKLRIYDISSKPKLMVRSNYKTRSFRNANLRYVFRCRAFSEDGFFAFFQDNPHLVNTDLRFVLREREFSRRPVGVKRVTYSTADVRWPSKDTFAYMGEICGTKYTGKAKYTP